MITKDCAASLTEQTKRIRVWHQTVEGSVSIQNLTLWHCLPGYYVLGTGFGDKNTSNNKVIESRPSDMKLKVKSGRSQEKQKEEVLNNRIPFHEDAILGWFDSRKKKLSRAKPFQ